MRQLVIFILILRHLSLSGYYYSGGELLIDQERLAKAAEHNDVLRYLIKEFFR